MDAVMRLETGDNLALEGLLHAQVDGSALLRELAVLSSSGRNADTERKIFDCIQKALPAALITVHTLEADGMLHLKAYQGFLPGPVLNVIQTIPPGKGMAGLALERLSPVTSCNLPSETSPQIPQGAKSVPVKGSIALPVCFDNTPVAVLGIGLDREHTFSNQEITLLSEIGKIMAPIFV